MDVVVVGSANLDVVLTVDTIPRPGETVLACGRADGPGGKGANQAVAAARAGARTAFVCALGDDDAAQTLRAALADVELHAQVAGRPTGTAYVVVDAAGENAIVVDSGANDALVLAPADRELVAGAQVVLCQLEVPVATVVDALRAASGLAVLNAAPAQELPPELTEALDVLIANEAEAQAVSRARDIDSALATLLARVPEVVVTLGAAGAVVARRGQPPVPVPAVPARRVVDTTGAGDAFCGAYAAARARGLEAVDAARLACAAASLSVERAGAASAPVLAEAQARLAAL
jgi:ribokinase